MENTENSTLLYDVIPGRENADIEFEQHILNNPENMRRWLQGEAVGQIIGDSNFDFLFNNKYNLHYEFDNRGYAWFNASELAYYLGYDRPYNMLRPVADDLKITISVSNPAVPELGLDLSNQANSLFELGSNQKHTAVFTIVHEAGVYNIAISARANRPEVVEFKRWITEELLPNIRRYGYYTSAKMRPILNSYPSLIQDFNNKIAEQNNQIAILKKQNNIINAKIGANIENGISIGELAKLIWNTGADIGRNRLIQEMSHDGYIMRSTTGSWIPTQAGIRSGYVIERQIDGNLSTLVTPRGVEYFIDLYKAIQL